MSPTAGASGKSLEVQESTTSGERPTTNAPTGSFHGAHHFAQHNPTFIDSMQLHQANVISGERSGMTILLDRTINDVFHDSSTHKPACHAGTRVELIDEGANWGRGTSDPDKALFWIDGPAGVGKSSVGQSCAEILGKENRLGAAVFFSRPNGRDDPSRLFTSIAYRLATQFDPYRQIVEQRIQKDPTVVTLSMQNQFRELLERPLQVLGESHHLTAVEGWVIVIDGLDECNGTEGEGNAGETHRDIVKIIATSVHARGTPFRWMILSRSEPSIVAAFKDVQVSSITIHKPLRISREIDNEIEHVIKEELTRIGKESGLSSSWFSESDVKTLVELCAGLWAYEATIVRFIAMKNSTGPASQLRIVLDFAIRQRATGDNPLEALDAFYTLIINSVPEKTLSIAQRIIILTTCDIDQVLYLSYILGISEAEIEYACGTLHAVLDIRTTRRRVTFHHASFTDYIKNRERSGALCVSGQIQKDFWQDTMKRMLEVAYVRQKGEWINNVPNFRIVIKHIFVAVILVFFSSDWRTDEAVVIPHRNYDFNTVLRTFINSRTSESSTLTFSSIRDSPNTYSLSLIDEFFKALKDLLKPLLRPCYNPFIHLNTLKLLKLVNEDPNVSDETISDGSARAANQHQKQAPFILGRGKTKVLLWICDNKGKARSYKTNDFIPARIIITPYPSFSQLLLRSSYRQGQYIQFIY